MWWWRQNIYFKTISHFKVTIFYHIEVVYLIWFKMVQEVVEDMEEEMSTLHTVLPVSTTRYLCSIIRGVFDQLQSGSYLVGLAYVHQCMSSLGRLELIVTKIKERVWFPFFWKECVWFSNLKMSLFLRYCPRYFLHSLSSTHSRVECMAQSTQLEINENFPLVLLVVGYGWIGTQGI